MQKQNKRLLVIFISCFALLLIPLVAMQLTNEVNWTLFDFIIAGILLFTTGFLLELILRKVKLTKYKIAFVVLLIALFLIIWTELAVGIIGTPFAGS